MSGIDHDLEIKRDREHIEELRWRSQSNYGLTITSAEFEFLSTDARNTTTTTGSCCCHYTISGDAPENLGERGACERTSTGEAYRTTYRTTKEDVALQLLEMFVAGAMLRNLSLSFLVDGDKSCKPDDFNRLMRAVFPVVCASRKLVSLSILFQGVSIFIGRSWLLATDSGVRRFLETDLPVLLRDDPVFSRLTVAAEGTAIELRDRYRPKPSLAQQCGECRVLAMAYSFSRTPEVKDSKAVWTLQVSRTCEPHVHLQIGSVQEMLAHLPKDILSKEVVLTGARCWPNHSCGRCREEMADLVARNITTLERLDASKYCFSIDTGLGVDPEAVMARALRCNRSLKEFQYRCTLVELHELLRVFVPNRGCDSNSSLSTLKVNIAGGAPMVECVAALAPLHGATVAALKEVIVCEAQPWRGFTVMLTSSDASQPTCPDDACVTLSKLRVLPARVRRWPRDDLAALLDFLTDMETVLKMSTAKLAEVEIVSHVLRGLALQLIRSSHDDTQPNPQSSFSALKLRFPILALRLPKTSKRAVARSWMTVVELLLRMVTTLKRVEVAHEPSRSAPCQFERDVQGKIRTGLRRLLKKELRGNTRLQSLQVGWWRVVRVGAGEQWEMRYSGPCLQRRDEYRVKVVLQ